VLAALGDTPGRIRAIVERMTPAQWALSYAPGKWTVAQLLLHLAQTELAFAARLRLALTTDRYVVQPFEQDDWLRREPPMGSLEALQAYTGFRQFNLPLFRSLTAEEWARVIHHPERGEMRVGWILELLAGHDLNHLQHIERVQTMPRG